MNILHTMTNNTDSKRKSVLLIGGSGLVGSRLRELLEASYDVDSAGTSSGLDITRPETLSKISDSPASVVLHLAAKTDVDGCEQDRSQGEDGESYKINVLGARNVAEVCSQSSKKMVYFSTDFVFDGKKTPPYEYTEEDTPDPVNWYATTKYEGEKEVASVLEDHLIMRIAYPYRANFDKKNDFVRAISSRLASGQAVSAVTDHLMCPTFIDDIAHAVDVCLREEVTGVVHAVGGSALTPYEAAVAIANEFGFDTHLISETTREKFFKERANRPFNLALKNGTLHRLGVSMRSFVDGLHEIHKNS